MGLVTSSLIATTPGLRPAEGQAGLTREMRNWEWVNHNALGTNYNPQNQINKENVQFLELKWIYPVPTNEQQGHNLVGYSPIEGTMVPPLVVDGVVYSLLSTRVLIALDAKTGEELWRHIPDFDREAVEARLPVLGQGGHAHAINYFDGKIWVYDLGCTIRTVDAKTGKLARAYEDLCLDFPFDRDDPRGWGIATNSGFLGGIGSHPPGIYKTGNLFIYAMGGPAEGTQGGRAFVSGVDMNTGQVRWRFHYQPPCADPVTCGPGKDGPIFVEEKREWGQWLVDNCNKIWIQGIKSCELDQDLLRNDWGDMRSNSGVSNIWGNIVVDEDTGIVYFGTAQPGPDWNATHAPGFRLFGSSVMALDARNGDLLWAHQTTARDLWDYDCSWNTVLANAIIEGANTKVVIKGCKNGIVHVLDAATGKLLQFLESPDIKRTPEQLLGNPEWNGILLDPRNREHMLKPWTNYPDTGAFFMNCAVTGCIESDIAYDPTRNMVYVGTYNNPWWSQAGNADIRGVGLGGSISPEDRPYDPKVNATINAFDLNDGSLKWKYFIPDHGFRGGVMTTGGLVWFSAVDGIQTALDADTGEVLFEANLGVSTLIMPTIGADADGKMKIFRIIGGRGGGLIGELFRAGSGVPGAIMVFGLPDVLPEPEVVEVERIVEVEVPGPERIVEVEVLGPERIVEVDVEVQVISPISYVAIGLGVVLVVIAGVLFARRRTIT